jgi:hypothetical protein
VAGLGGQTVLVIGGIGTLVAGIAGLIAYASIRSVERSMSEDDDGTREVLDIEVEPIDAMHPFPDRPDVTRIPESERLPQPIVDR